MSDKKKENLFAKLAQQNAQANRDQLESEFNPPLADPPPSPPLPEPEQPKSSSPKKKVAPARGKRFDPEYCQANAYVPKTVRKAVDRVLLDLDGLDYSTLVTDLLRKWLKTKGVAE